jgi:4-hydroxy-2-oxoheptanedioate aldolase
MNTSPVNQLNQLPSDIINNFKHKLASSHAFGPFMKTSDASIVEATGRAGFDFCVLDQEHGPVSLEKLPDLIRAAQLTGMLPIVRVREADPVLIGQVLDAGALGALVPQVENAEQAAAMVKAARFYPKGMRGVCVFVRAAQFSNVPAPDYFASQDDNLVILQVEGIDAIDNHLDAILDVEGYDLLFIGPFDLSQSVGCPGEVLHPEVINKMEYIVDQAKAKNRKIGTFCANMEAARIWKNAGVQLISYSVDMGIYLDACKSLKAELSV